MAGKSFFNRELSPFLQGGFVIALMVVLMLFALLLEWLGMSKKDEMTPWIIAIAMLLFYTLLNCIFSLSATNENRYWGRSILTFVLIVCAGALLSWAISGLSLFESKSLKGIFVVFVFVYFILISILGFMRKIVSFAQKQEE